MWRCSICGYDANDTWFCQGCGHPDDDEVSEDLDDEGDDGDWDDDGPSAGCVS